MGTAAHVVEPTLPGARDSYIDLGRFYDGHRLEKRRAELRELTRRYKSAYALAYDYLAAAGALNIDSSVEASGDTIRAAAENCAALLPVAAPGAGIIRHCFLDSFCGKGDVSLLENFDGWRIYNINASPADGSAVLETLGKALSENAYSVFFCHSPLNPTMLRHLLVHCHKTVFTTSRVPESTCAAAISAARPDEKLTARYKILIEGAGEMLTLAKRAHDALEEVYNPCVDFAGVHAEAKKHINTIL